MTGVLVVNKFLFGEKFERLHKHLQNTAKNLGITLKIKNNEQMLFCKEKYDFVLFWDKDINLAKKIENSGTPVFNSSNAIALCDDKAKTHLALEGLLPQPKTIAAPLSYDAADYSEFVKCAVKELGLPVVFKECYGSFGQQVYLCQDEKEVLSRINQKPFLLQEYIEEADGEDIRIEVVFGKCVAAMKRKNKNDFRSNITNGGAAEPYLPTESEKALAVNACKALGLDFGGVDILCGKYVCEVNSNAHIINLLQVTGIDCAEEIFKGIKDRFQL